MGQRTRRLPFLLAPLLFAAVACSEPDGPADVGVTTTVDTVDGVVRVRNAGAAPEVSLRPVLAIGETGGVDAVSPEEFGRVRGVLADGDGRLFIGDGHAREIRVFGPDGAYLRTLGREGGGPGEVGGLHGLAWAAPDTMAVLDYGNGRVMLLDTRGEQVGQWPWGAITGSRRFLYDTGAREFYTFFFGAGERNARVWVRYVNGEPVDTLEEPSLDGAAAGTVTCFGDGIGFYHNPLRERLLTTPGPGGATVTALSSTYRIAFTGEAGDTLRTVSRDVPRVPVTDADWAPVDSAYAEFRDAWAGTRCDGDIRRPEHRPAVLGIFFDHQGRLMVEWESEGGPALDLYDDAYRLLGTIQLPDRDESEPVRVRDGRLYLVVKDSLDVQQVRVFDLDGVAPSGNAANAG
ncbi:MAG TPA: hypothetical protein VK966_12170 [Longimicrobiales bacterium]|nr:hypothetical protein [Longimicrobiales bacterium]